MGEKLAVEKKLLVTEGSVPEQVNKDSRRNWHNPSSSEKNCHENGGGDVLLCFV